jgi:nicotinate-nucleotide adenylyltransferase
MKWGLFGGTFDPIHIAHLRCAEEMREALDLEKIIFIPAAYPPLKKRKMTSFQDRLSMVKLAIDGDPTFEVSSLEGKREGRSYTIDTVNYFRGSFGKSLDLFFILGQDAFADIQKWKSWQNLLRLCHFGVMTRPGCENKSLDEILSPGISAHYRYMPKRKGFRSDSGTFIFFRSVTFLDISSTDIRKRLLKKQSTRYLMPDPVLEYIAKKSLYTDTS